MPDPPQEASRLVRFGVFELDPGSGDLRKAGIRLSLPDQPLQILTALLERPGELVSRDELRQRLWPGDTFVDFEHGLNAAVKRLRDVLGDSADAPRFVETVPRRGYRLVASVNADSPTPSESVAAFSAGSAALHAEESASSASEPAVRLWWRLALGVLAATVVGVVLLGTMRWRYWLRPEASPSSREPSIQRITANPSQLPISGAAISPDGRYVAYSDAQGVHLIVRPSGEARLLASTAGMAVEWFPDSTHLLATTAGSPDRPFQAWTLSVLGGRQPSAHTKVSPDGRWRLETKFAFKKEGNALLPSVEFWLSDANGDDPRQVTSFKGNVAHFTWVDSQHVVFESVSFPKMLGSLQCLDVRDGRTHTLVDGSVKLVASTLPGGRVMYVSSSPDGSEGFDELWELRVDPGSGERRDGPRRLMRFDEQNMGIGGMTATADGKTILLGRYHSQADVYVARLSPGNVRLSEPSRLTLDDRDDEPSDWMPDGRRVIFVSPRRGSDDIYSQAIDAVTADVLIRGDGDQAAPRVTPDKRWILYLSRLPGAKTLRLMRSPIDGGPGEKLLSSDSYLYYRCGLHALCILEERDESRVTTYRLDPMTGKKEAMFTRALSLDPAVSPDGTQIAYVASGPDCRVCSPTMVAAIKIVSLKGETQREIPLRLDGLAQSLDWSTDGRGFFVGVISADSSRLYFIERSGALHLLWKTAQGPISAIPSPDGRHLAIRARTTDSNVWTVDGF